MTDSTNKLILVADDDAMNREIMEAFLSSVNYGVELAHNGQTALQKADECNPDLIILDVKMPDLTGYEVCEQLRLSEKTTTTPIMIVTGFDADEDRDRAFSAGATAFLPRPFGGDELMEQVANLLNS